ncbi:MAG: hydroxymethylglutaryl-CoA synthase [Candidatus Methanoplasma sp.]|jgi:hydroxymethylglutaryl-CoA synthase|nr:hydroxymethylglutaryl-CoA synthase [Candidatus Methanoplasma sp.]
MDVGIVSYGAYVPRYRIKPEEIGRIWGVDGKGMGKGLMIHQKSVPGVDEDVITISTEAARYMMSRVPYVNPRDIGALYVGSESHPYAVKPTSTVVAEAIEATPALTAADMEFACKAGTAGIQACMGMVASGMIKYGVAIGADTSQGAPGDALEYSASAGGAAFLIGSEKIIAKINKTISFTTDTPDFWRREGQPYPLHGGRFTGDPAYFKHITSAAKMMLTEMGTVPGDYKHAIFHQPNGKFPTRVAGMLGFTPEQIETGLLTPNIGNTYSGAVPLGLSAVLDKAEPGDRIFVTSYGSGAGSDAFDITVTDEIRNYKRDNAPTLDKVLADTVCLDYGLYTKFKKMIIMPE